MQKKLRETFVKNRVWSYMPNPTYIFLCKKKELYVNLVQSLWRTRSDHLWPNMQTVWTWMEHGIAGKLNEYSKSFLEEMGAVWSGANMKRSIQAVQSANSPKAGLLGFWFWACFSAAAEFLVYLHHSINNPSHFLLFMKLSALEQSCPQMWSYWLAPGVWLLFDRWHGSGPAVPLED